MEFAMNMCITSQIPYIYSFIAHGSYPYKVLSLSLLMSNNFTLANLEPNSTFGILHDGHHVAHKECVGIDGDGDHLLCNFQEGGYLEHGPNVETKVSCRDIASIYIQFNLPHIMHVATKVHVISRRCAMLAWVCDNKKLVQHVTLWNNTKSTLQL